MTDSLRQVIAEALIETAEKWFSAILNGADLGDKARDDWWTEADAILARLRSRYGDMGITWDDDGEATVWGLEAFGDGWSGPRWTGELNPDAEEGDQLYRLVERSEQRDD